MSKPVVLDNTVLSNFSRVDKTYLVIRLWPKLVLTTPAVMKEHLIGVKRGILPKDTWIELPVTELTSGEEAYSRTLPRSLGAGERSCLAVAHLRSMVLATDDLDARKAAAEMGLHVTGTLGILALCVRQSLLSRSEGNRVLDLLIENSYRSPAKNLDSLL